MSPLCAACALARHSGAGFIAASSTAHRSRTGAASTVSGMNEASGPDQTPSPTPAQPTDPPPPTTPVESPPPAAVRTRLRDRAFRLRSVAAVGIAALLIGGTAGAGVTALVVDHDDRERPGFDGSFPDRERGDLPGFPPGGGQPGMPPNRDQQDGGSDSGSGDSGDAAS